MNPGNGIETPLSVISRWYSSSAFHINESRQRDWNRWLSPKGSTLLTFHINESRQRDWNPTCSPWAKANNFHINESRQRDWNNRIALQPGRVMDSFTLMNPGNGIETRISLNEKTAFAPTGFHINESRQRDWNTPKVQANSAATIIFHINESRQRDWNLIDYVQLMGEGTFTLMNPGNGIETFSPWERLLRFHCLSH